MGAHTGASLPLKVSYVNSGRFYTSQVTTDPAPADVCSLGCFVLSRGLASKSTAVDPAGLDFHYVAVSVVRC